ncbi:hypothetical protein [Allocoleopsis sp.]|uniref:hypothetical protein n=1 Tax=Allocoleopsis sp. TaxID=3088169 RepID=UPI002FD2A875
MHPIALPDYKFQNPSPLTRAYRAYFAGAVGNRLTRKNQLADCPHPHHRNPDESAETQQNQRDT